jgi:hypothetical protein
LFDHNPRKLTLRGRGPRRLSTIARHRRAEARVEPMVRGRIGE